MPALPRTFNHTSPLDTLAPILEELLPYSLPVLRRIQFHFQTPHRVVLSTVDPASPPEIFQAPIASPSEHSLPWERASVPTCRAPFAVLYVDRSRSPETESWIFSTADLPDPSPLSASEQALRDAALRPHLVSVLAHAAQDPAVRSSLAAAQSQPEDPSAMITGSIHEATLRLLIGAEEWDARDKAVEYGWGTTNNQECWTRGNRSSGGILRGYTNSWLKYMYGPVSSSSQSLSSPSPQQELGGGGNHDDVIPPAGLHWAEKLAAADYQLVCASTKIPRSPSTLAQLPARALRDAEGQLQAWAFTTPDGSFGVLHVQPEHRGKGVAQTLIAGLRAVVGSAKVKDGEEGEYRLAFAGVGEGKNWSHSDTAENNTAARKVLEGSGGVVNWVCYWGFTDLEAAAREARGFESA